MINTVQSTLKEHGMNCVSPLICGLLSKYIVKFGGEDFQLFEKLKDELHKDIKLTHRNLLHSYTLTMRKQKEKLRKQYHSPLQQKE